MEYFCWSYTLCAGLYQANDCEDVISEHLTQGLLRSICIIRALRSSHQLPRLPSAI
jgi:hypothetical protein